MVGLRSSDHRSFACSKHCALLVLKRLSTPRGSVLFRFRIADAVKDCANFVRSSRSYAGRPVISAALRLAVTRQIRHFTSPVAKSICSIKFRPIPRLLVGSLSKWRTFKSAFAYALAQIGPSDTTTVVKSFIMTHSSFLNSVDWLDTRPKASGAKFTGASFTLFETLKE